MKYRVWHISANNQYGRTEYTREVVSPKEAVFVLDVLARYDLALGDTIIWNSQGLQVSADDGATWEE